MCIPYVFINVYAFICISMYYCSTYLIINCGMKKGYNIKKMFISDKKCILICYTFGLTGGAVHFHIELLKNRLKRFFQSSYQIHQTAFTVSCICCVSCCFENITFVSYFHLDISEISGSNAIQDVLSFKSSIT